MPSINSNFSSSSSSYCILLASFVIQLSPNQINLMTKSRLYFSLYAQRNTKKTTVLTNKKRRKKLFFKKMNNTFCWVCRHSESFQSLLSIRSSVFSQFQMYTQHNLYVSACHIWTNEWMLCAWFRWLLYFPLFHRRIQHLPFISKFWAVFFRFCFNLKHSVCLCICDSKKNRAYISTSVHLHSNEQIPKLLCVTFPCLHWCSIPLADWAAKKIVLHRYDADFLTFVAFFGVKI